MTKIKNYLIKRLSRTGVFASVFCAEYGLEIYFIMKYVNCVDDRNFSNEENAGLIENGKTIKYVFEKAVYESGISLRLHYRRYDVSNV